MMEDNMRKIIVCVCVCVCVCVWITAVQQTLTEHCTSTMIKKIDKFLFRSKQTIVSSCLFSVQLCLLDSRQKAALLREVYCQW